MQNPRLASRYAKSLLDLAVEKNCLDAVLQDMQVLTSICTESRDFDMMRCDYMPTMICYDMK